MILWMTLRLDSVPRTCDKQTLGPTPPRASPGRNSKNSIAERIALRCRKPNSEPGLDPKPEPNEVRVEGCPPKPEPKKLR